MCFGFSAKLFSVNADTVIQSERNVYAGITGNNGNAGIQIYAYSLKPYIFDSSETGFTRIYNAGTSLSYSTIRSWTTVIAQEYVFQVRMYNYSDDIVVYNSATMQFLPQRPAVTDPADTNHEYGYSVKDMANNPDYSYQISTSGYIQIKSSNGEAMHVPPHCIRVFDFVVTSYCNEMSGYGRFLDAYDVPLSSVAFESGAALNVNNNFRVYDIDYNLYEVEADLDSIYQTNIAFRADMNAKLQSINSKLDTLIHNQTQQQTEISSNITSQTEQQEQQYNEFSAGSDSSDSSNINSAISGGTDAVKQKMGLFSFFDGIVNSMSDILTSDHERHLVLPALDVPLPDETVHVWDRKEFDFEELENNFGALLTVVRFATVALCYSVMISGAYNIFHKFIGVKDGDA